MKNDAISKALKKATKDWNIKEVVQAVIADDPDVAVIQDDLLAVLADIKNGKLARQYIRDDSGKPLYVILPIEEYEKLVEVDEYGFRIEEDDSEEWQDVPYEKDDNDDAVIPHEVVMITINHNINLLGAWRIYRGLSQQDVAAKVGITQGAISQMEQPDNKPQKKTLEKFAAIYECEVEQMY
ncbi:helix-turn-helix transcriptional regulator [Haemophilus haemoglobinophilus]|nr:helix-turn-helix transcriptional regulator [Canicola haemoglobinophilus]MBN6712366.1 helix-turn-helix transcriptional regulator [Canicola haemoglobinophilus]